MADSEKVEGEVSATHKYRICEVLPREKQTGRPPRNLIIGWDALSAEDVATLRRLHEPRLAANQIAELDGRIVARGSAVTQEDVAPEEPEAPPSEATITVPAGVQTENPAQMTEFAHRLCWDIYQRDMAASEELRKQAHVLNERAIQQGKQIDAMMAELVGMRADMMRQVQQQAQARPLTVQDIKELIQAGAVIMHNMKVPGQQ